MCKAAVNQGCWMWRVHSCDSSSLTIGMCECGRCGVNFCRFCLFFFAVHFSLRDVICVKSAAKKKKKRNKFWFNLLKDSSRRITERMQPRCILCVMLKDTELGGLSLSPGFSARSGRRAREWKREGERIHTWKSEAVPRTSLQQHFLFFFFFCSPPGCF